MQELTEVQIYGINHVKNMIIDWYNCHMLNVGLNEFEFSDEQIHEINSCADYGIVSSTEEIEAGMDLAWDELFSLQGVN